jgi:hypothetical protein
MSNIGNGCTTGAVDLAVSDRLEASRGSVGPVVARASGPVPPLADHDKALSKQVDDLFVPSCGDNSVNGASQNIGDMAWAFVRYSRDYLGQEQTTVAQVLGIHAHQCEKAWVTDTAFAISLLCPETDGIFWLQGSYAE